MNILRQKRYTSIFLFSIVLFAGCKTIEDSSGTVVSGITEAISDKRIVSTFALDISDSNVKNKENKIIVAEICKAIFSNSKDVDKLTIKSFDYKPLPIKTNIVFNNPARKDRKAFDNQKCSNLLPEKPRKTASPGTSFNSIWSEYYNEYAKRRVVKSGDLSPEIFILYADALEQDRTKFTEKQFVNSIQSFISENSNMSFSDLFNKLFGGEFNKAWSESVYHIPREPQDKGDGNMIRQQKRILNLADVPDEPGIYLIRDTYGNNLYVGQSGTGRHGKRGLRTRLSEHLNLREGTALKAGIMYEIRWATTESERMAKIAEGLAIIHFNPSDNKGDDWRGNLKRAINDNLQAQILGEARRLGFFKGKSAKQLEEYMAKILAVCNC
jgi:hypothetical protein